MKKFWLLLLGILMFLPAFAGDNGSSLAIRGNGVSKETTKSQEKINFCSEISFGLVAQKLPLEEGGVNPFYNLLPAGLADRCKNTYAPLPEENRSIHLPILLLVSKPGFSPVFI